MLSYLPRRQGSAARESSCPGLMRGFRGTRLFDIQRDVSACAADQVSFSSS